MSESEANGSESRLVRAGSGAPRVRNFLEPSIGGRAERFRQSVGGGHAVRSFVVAITATYITLSLLLVGAGLLVTHVLEHGFLGAWDHHVIHWFVIHGTGFLNKSSAVVTFAADTFTVVGVAAIVTIVLLIRRWGRRAFLLATALAIELSVFLTVNAIVARPRPPVRHLGGTPSTFSFPSGHTAATIALYGAIAVIIGAATTRRGPRIAAWTVVVILTVAVALSRLYRGEHYPSDVLGGALLGIGALSAAVFIIRSAGVKGVSLARPPAGSKLGQSSAELEGGPE